MAAITFDTHEFVKRLRESGLSEPQAEAITDLQRQAIAAAVDQARLGWNPEGLATLKEVDARIKEAELKLELARADLKRDIAETKSELIRWVVAVGVLQITVITALVLKLASQT